MNIGDKIKEARIEKNLSVRSLAKEAGIDNSYLSKIERNISVPSLDTLVKLGKALDIPLVGLQMALLKNKEDAIIYDLMQHYIDSYRLDIDIKLEYAGDCRISELKRNISRLVSETLIEIHKEDEC